MEILNLKSVQKYYEARTALNSVSLSVPKGSTFGLLGPNGAGKTTLLRIITGIFHPDEGQILFYGKPVKKIPQQYLGYLPEERGLYKKMKLREQLVFFASLKNLSYKQACSSTDYWLEKFGLKERQSHELGQLSKGMQQKVQLISALIHNPELVILDEPFSGFDPVNANLAKNIIHELNKRGTTFILSTHRMENIESLCSHIAMLDEGKVVLKGAVDEVKSSFSEKYYKVEGTGKVSNSGKSYIANSVTQKGGFIQAFLALKSPKGPNDLLTELMGNMEIKSFSEVAPTIEEIFLKTISKEHE